MKTSTKYYYHVHLDYRGSPCHLRDWWIKAPNIVKGILRRLKKDKNFISLNLQPVKKHTTRTPVGVLEAIEDATDYNVHLTKYQPCSIRTAAKKTKAQVVEKTPTESELELF